MKKQLLLAIAFSVIFGFLSSDICFASVKYDNDNSREMFAARTWQFLFCIATKEQYFTITSGRGIVSPRAGERFYFSLLIQQPPETSKIFGGSFIFSCVYSFYRVYSLYLSAMLLPMSTPMTDAIIRPLVQPLESPRQWRPLTFVSKFSSILMRLE